MEWFVFSYQEMCFVDVDWTRELRFLSDGLAEDHDLLEEEAGEGPHLGRAVLWSPWKRVQGIQGTFVQELALSCYFTLEK